MRLRNKQTGEIVPASNVAVGIGEDGKWYGSLAMLNEEWEDYEELDEIWYIDWKGDIRSADIDNDWAGEKQIGNYFETKEEAEKAVEKLKAWKRIKDKGFRFTEWGIGLNDGLTIKAKYSGKGIYEDMMLLFGGEE